jgi:aldehyde dehydrogenase (NAD+)
MLSLVPLAGAIAAGNTVVLKPSNDSRASTELLVKLIRTYCDPYIVQCVGSEIPGDGVDVMQTLLKQKFDHIFFTGSAKVGKIVASAAAETLTPTTLELGGKNPVVVTECADLNIAAKQCMWGRTINCGQQCIAPEYVICHESRIDEFLESCKYWASHFVPDATIEGSMARIGGPLNRMAGIAKMLDDANSGIASDKVICGGKYDVKTRMVEPTVIKCGCEDSPMMQNELFAPILCVLPYAALSEAVEMIRSKPKPLSMYIFSRTASKTRVLLDNTQAGGVTVNGVLTHCAHDCLPFGGVGDSGYGRYHGRYTVECFQREKPVLQKTRGVGDCGLITDPALLYLPNAKWKVSAMRLLC